MKYFVNTKTKEHKLYDRETMAFYPIDWKVVQGDADGWIKHDPAADVAPCPLADGTKCEARLADGSTVARTKPETWDWGMYSQEPMLRIIAYRPILQPTTTDEKPDLITRIRTAKQHADDLPALVEELREQLGSDIVALLTGEHEEDMSDPDNWREGDLVECIYENSIFYPKGYIATVGTDDDGDFGVMDNAGYVLDIGKIGGSQFSPQYFRFHSRPSKEQKQ